MAVMTTPPEELERMRIRRQQDEASALSYAEERGKKKGKREGKREGRQEGKREGKREGIQEKAIAIAKKMKAKGYNINDIIEITGLTVDDILRL